MKTLTSRDLAFLKRNAQNVYPRVMRYTKLKKELESIQEKIKEVEDEIFAIETGSRLITGGFNSTELIVRTAVTNSNKLDKYGCPSTSFIYEPDTEILSKNEDGTWSIIKEQEEAAEPAEISEPVECETNDASSVYSE